MMQKQSEVSPVNTIDWVALPSQTLVTLLALVGTKKMEASELERRTKLSPAAFGELLSWLQREYLVDVVSHMGMTGVQAEVGLTGRGERLLISMLERTCELPELR